MCEHVLREEECVEGEGVYEGGGWMVGAGVCVSESECVVGRSECGEGGGVCLVREEEWYEGG